MADFVGFALVALTLLWRPGGLDRSAMLIVAAALFVAANGYAWLGSPNEAGAPATGQLKPVRGDAMFANERRQFLGKVRETASVLATAEAYNRAGEDKAAVDLLADRITQHPADVDLRIGYAHALFVLARGNFTPAVRLAFNRAEQLAPSNPAPRYFLGLSQIEIGDIAGARQTWGALETSLPNGSAWKAPLKERLFILEMASTQRVNR